MTESADHPSCGCSRSEPVRICVAAVLVFRFWGTGIDFACHILVHVPGLPTMNAKLIGVYIITPGWIQIQGGQPWMWPRIVNWRRHALAGMWRESCLTVLVQGMSMS